MWEVVNIILVICIPVNNFAIIPSRILKVFLIKYILLLPSVSADAVCVEVDKCLKTKADKNESSYDDSTGVSTEKYVSLRLIYGI